MGELIAGVAMIGGFAVLELSSFDDAIQVSRRYVEILGGTVEIDLRVIDLAES